MRAIVTLSPDAAYAAAALAATRRQNKRHAASALRYAAYASRHVTPSISDATSFFTSQCLMPTVT